LDPAPPRLRRPARRAGARSCAGRPRRREERDPLTYRIVTVCTGNICRSPMAEYALRQALEQEGLADRVEVASVGTSGWEIGNPVDSRAGALLSRHGLDAGSHRARQMDASELEQADLILTLDHDHVGPVQRLLDGEAGQKIRMV